MSDNLTIVRIAIAELKPARYNPRVALQPGTPEYENLRRSITEFGLVDPLIVNADYTIIGGHQRYRVLSDLGRTEADCVIVDLPPDKERALNIALNRIEGMWDEAALRAVLLELSNSEEIDATLTGFSDKEINALISEVAKIETPAVIAKVSREVIDQAAYSQRVGRRIDFEDYYTSKGNPVHYEVTGEPVSLAELIDHTKRDELANAIAVSSLSNDEKLFLIQAAQRHNVFRYDKIAEYYARGSPELQRHMEASALVIIDYQDAIKNGYVRLHRIIEAATEEDVAAGTEEP